MKKTVKVRAVLCAVFQMLLLLSCAREPGRDYWPTQSWKRAAPESAGIDSERLLTVLQSHDLDGIGIHSILLVRNGYLVLEAYGYPYSSETIHNVNSVTKSFVSTLYGIAMDKKLVPGVHTKALNCFPVYKSGETDPRKLGVTVEDLLTMRSGQNWNENAAQNSFSQMIGAEDCLKYILDIPMTGEGGLIFNYNSGASHILAAILDSASGGLEIFARENLLAPIGIKGYYWKKDPQGIPMGGYGLSMKSEDMARLGFLCLNGGKWDGRRIVPSRWIREAARVHTDTKSSFNPDGAYGYHWWVAPDGSAFSAQGYGGQMIIVKPSDDVVLVTTSYINIRKAAEFSKLISEEIPQTIISEKPLPENPEAVKKLIEFCREWSSPPPVKNIEMPARFESVSEIRYTFDSNDRSYRTVLLESSGPDGIRISYELISSAGGREKSVLAAGCDGRYRFSETVLPESVYQFGDYHATVACRTVVTEDKDTILVDIVPLGVAEGPYRERISFEGDRISITRINMTTRTGYTLTGRRLL